MRRVVITGMGALTPIGNNVSDFWKNLQKGISGAAPITRFDPTHFKTKFACELKDFNAADHLDRNEIKRNDLYVQYALVAAEEALKNAALDLNAINLKRTGVIWASGNAGWTSFEEQVTEHALGDGTPRFNPFFIPRALGNMASGIISIKYGFKGITYTAVSACAASNSAIMDAFNYIRWGKADIIFTGGSEAPISKSSIGGFGSMKALSTKNENANTASRPFDQDRDGFVMGEGAGALVLEEYEHAKARGAVILAEVAGAAMTSDAYHMSATHPEGEGASDAMQLALEEAGLSPEDVDYINAHATSTPLGDVSEINAIQKCFGDNQPKISATKSMTGHLLGAAGAIEAVASVLAIQHDTIPPTINIENLDERIPANIKIAKEKISQPVNVAMSNNFGFGGHNAVVIFKKA
ncbi:MAG: beta-ketoacyl-ACP synthase II [Candidatus Cyclobacteriaceae bacterium M2_1C_046]